MVEKSFTGGKNIWQICRDDFGYLIAKSILVILHEATDNFLVTAYLF